MRDFLIGDDRFMSLCLATTGDKCSEVRLGKRTFDNQKEYKGLIKELPIVNSELIKISKLGRLHIKSDEEKSKEAKSIVRDRVPNKIQGNTQVYEFANVLLSLKDKFKLRKSHFSKEKDSWQKCFISSDVRSGLSSTLKEQSLMLRKNEDLINELAKMTSLEVALEELNYSRVGEHNSYLTKKSKIKQKNKNKKKEKIKLDKISSPYSKRDLTKCFSGIDLFVIGGLKVFTYEGKSYIFTDNHYARLIEYLQSLRNSLMLTLDIFHNCDVSEIPEVIHSCCYDVAVEDSNAVGEAMKAARQLTFLSLETSAIMGNSKELYKSTLSTERAVRADMMISTASVITSSLIIKTNIFGFYTALPHPDAPLHQMFKSIEGVKQPNSVDPKFISRFEGAIRRSIYSSMRRSGHDVRLNSTDFSSNELAQSSQDISQSALNSTKYSTYAWSKTEFQKVRSVPTLRDIEVPIASKASSAGVLMTTGEEQEAKAYFAGYGKSIEEKFFRPSSVNDASEAIKGTIKMDIEKCLKRFNKIIALHERFESRFLDKEIDEIPSEALEEFLQAHPSAQYLVNTEGKFGEIHKVVTRLFYMAEQELKALTQRVERIARHVSRNQMGVSIVKSYVGRRSDLDRSLNAMIGSAEGVRSVAVSFDMTEFSKKFPMTLLRSYGKVLSEITGDTELERIDLFFRASKVMYSNRGYYNDLRGARGAFEGFLNFVWTSIHAAIMEVSLETTGVKGDLLTYSDDGLLIFYPSSNLKDVKIEDLINKIRDSYQKLGLIFHIGKTLISDHMWEYLGDVCYNNRLIPMWFKELVKIGRVNSTKGLTPLYDKISVINSQAMSMVVSSGSPSTAYVVKRYACGRILRRWLPVNSSLLLEILLILPTSCGGLRITSPFEDTNVTNLSSDMEIYSDLVLLERYNKGLFAQVTSSILTRIPDPVRRKRNYRKSISFLSLFKTDLPDTSGDSVVASLLEKLQFRLSYKMPKDPLSNEVCEEIYDILSASRNVDLDSVQMLLNAIPGMSEYRSHKGVLKGAGALRLLERRELKEAQKQDTINVKNAIKFWYFAITDSLPATRVDFLEECARRNYPDIHVLRPRAPPRLCLTRTYNPTKASIEVVFKGGMKKDIYSSEYKEPFLRTSIDKSTLMWNSEMTGSNEIRDIRKMLKAVYAIISHSPYAENTVRAICEVFDIIPPQTLAGKVRGSHRDRKGVRRETESKLILPRFYMAQGDYRYLNQLSRFLKLQDRKDENTYGICAMSLSYFHHAREFHPGSIQPDTDEKYYYMINSSLFKGMFTPIEMTDSHETPIVENTGNLPVNISTEYLAYSQELVDQLSKVKMLEISRDIGENLSDEHNILIIGNMIKVVERYLNTMGTGCASTILQEATIPRLGLLRTYIVRRAIIASSISLHDPRSRTLISIELSNIREGLQNDTSYSSRHIDTLLSKMEELYWLLPTDIRNSVPNVGPEDYRQNKEFYINLISAYLFDSSLLSSKKMIVIFPKNYHSHEVSNDHKVAYRQMVRETIIALFSTFKKVNWDRRRMKIEYPNLMTNDPDEIIDCLKVVYPMFRSSKHRSMPYNARSVLIMLKKFYYIVYLMYLDYLENSGRFGSEQSDVSVLNKYMNWRPSEKDEKLILNIVNNPGPDMIDNVRRKTPAQIIKRAFHYYKYYRKTSRVKSGISLSRGPNNSMIIGLQTTFKETIMRVAQEKVHAYSYGMSKLISQEFLSLRGELSVMAGIETDTDAVTGTDMIDTNMEEKPMTLILQHADIVKLRNGFVGYKSDGNSQYLINQRIIRHYKLENFVRIPTLSAIDSSHHFKAVDYRCSNLGKAITTYIHLSKGSESSMSIVKEKPTDLPTEIFEPKTNNYNDDEHISEEELFMRKYNQHLSLESLWRAHEHVIMEAESRKDKSERFSWADLCENDFGDEITRSINISGILTGSISEDVILKKLKAESGTGTNDEQEIDVEDDSDEEDEIKNELKPVNDSGHHYRVIGVTNKKNILHNYFINPKVGTTLSDSIAEVVDDLTFEGSLYETGTVISSLSSYHSASTQVRNAPFTLSAQIEAFTPGRQVNESSATFQAALELAKDHNDAPSHVASYVLFHAWVSGVTNRESLTGKLNEVIRSYRNDQTSLDLMTDVSMLVNWLRSSDITAGPSVDHQKKIKLMKILRKALSKVKHKFTPLPVACHFRSFDEARLRVLRSGANQITSYKNFIYYTADEERESVSSVSNLQYEDIDFE